MSPFSHCRSSPLFHIHSLFIILLSQYITVHKVTTMAKLPRNLFNEDFYTDLAKWRKDFPDDLYFLGFRSPDGFFHLTQTDSADSARINMDYLNDREVKNNRQPRYEYHEIADIPDCNETWID